MDRALKERITGAIVLVVVAVLIVPVFLDGPATGTENVQEIIVLPGQEAQAASQKTIVLERDRKQPVPLARSQSSPARVMPAKFTESQSEVERPATESVDTTESTPPETLVVAAGAKPEKSDPVARPPAATKTAAASTTGMWAVQLGSFSSQDNAERLAATLRKDGYAAFISQLKSGSQQLHRVRVGPQKDRSSAESVAAQLQKAGHKGQVVPHP